MALSSKQKNSIIKGLVALIVILNILDAGSTLYGLNRNIVTEVNPIMAFFYEIGPSAFLFFKLFIVALFALFWLSIEQIRKFLPSANEEGEDVERLVWMGSIFLAVFYTLLMVYQTVGIYLSLKIMA